MSGDTSIEITAGVSVATSRYWSTNTGIVSSASGVFLIDAGVFPDELEALARGNTTVVGGISTHGHWDHILWDTSLGDEATRLASPDCVADVYRNRADLLSRIRREEAAANTTWSDEHIGRLTAAEFGMIEGTPLELVSLPGHACGHSGIFVHGADTLFVGDMLSDIDPPALDEAPESLGLYRGSLAHLRARVASARTVVPGHGTWCDASEAGRRIDLDEHYLHALSTAVDDGLSGKRDLTSVSAAVMDATGDERLSTDTGRMLHEANVATLIADPHADPGAVTQSRETGSFSPPA